MVQRRVRERDRVQTRSGLWKTGGLSLLTIVLCGYQSLFFKAELIRQFGAVWESFGTVLPAYTRYGLMLVQHPYGWLLLVANFALGIWGALQRSHLYSALAVAGMLLFTLGLLCVFYLPAFTGG